jgi:hypothetical protein
MKELPASVDRYPETIKTLAKYKNYHPATQILIDFAYTLLAESAKANNDKKSKGHL